MTDVTIYFVIDMTHKINYKESPSQ